MQNYLTYKKSVSVQRAGIDKVYISLFYLSKNVKDLFFESQNSRHLYREKRAARKSSKTNNTSDFKGMFEWARKQFRDDGCLDLLTFQP